MPVTTATTTVEPKTVVTILRQGPLAERSITLPDETTALLVRDWLSNLGITATRMSASTFARYLQHEATYV